MVADLRRLVPEDVPDAFELSTFAGWNQLPADWLLLLSLAPEGCFAIEVDGRVVATTTLLSHAGRLAWLGMVLTHPNYRRQGFARRLMTHALEHARLLGIPTVKLDATDAGRPLYESFGFRSEQMIERWTRSGSAPFEASNENRQFNATLHAEACGYDRGRLLDALSLRGSVSTTPDADLFLRSGRVYSYLGPCIARQPVAAADLILAAMAEHATRSWCWDILPANRGAVALAQRLGFVRQRILTRMVWGQDLRGREDWIYAGAGFDLG